MAVTITGIPTIIIIGEASGLRIRSFIARGLGRLKPRFHADERRQGARRWQRPQEPACSTNEVRMLFKGRYVARRAWRASSAVYPSRKVGY